ncbi:N-acetylmuramoyl-L-alanine amidase [Holdemanella biformis]|uniref:N-acetylmuramoyl-L-alanine amidase n=1 Tax=Holdemanella biformis TaxID=1735 RepID=UPI0015F5093C|nr:N-acetylmuramoyl-L-alanine amidase [Holdemanella biformis]
MDIVKNLVSSSLYYCKCPYSMNPTRIVVHNTANDASARNEIQYMINNRNEVSYHYAVDDKEIVQGIPENRNAWHAGDGGNGVGNRQGIAIEICYSKSGGARFDAAEALAAKFIASKLKEKGWGIDKVTKHQDYSNKYCPHRTLDKGWQRFLNMIQKELGQTTTSSSSAPNSSSGEKYSTGTPICTNTLSVNCNGTGKIYTGDWSGSIGKVIKGAKYPYRVDRNGVAIGWTSDTGIDTDPHVPGGSAQSTPTVLNSIPSDFNRESATFYPNTTLKIRKAPTEKGIDTGLYYSNGMSVQYDGYVKREGFVWISWISASTGERRWMKAGVLNSKGYNTNPYGRFV